MALAQQTMSYNELATSLGRMLGGTSEYQALEKAMQEADNDRDLVEMRNEIQKLEQVLQSGLAQGTEPTKEQVQEYEGTVQRLQALASYQGIVAAQSNFDRVMQKVNEAIQLGMQEGAKSRIILPS